MLRTIRLALPLLLALLLAAATTPALAAPIGWKSVDVTLHADEERPTLLVSGELPATAELPYETELAVPAGTTLQWIGEILGGPASEDPTLEYVKTTVRGMDVYRFTLTKSRTAQVEGAYSSATAFDGATYSSTLSWIAWRDLPQVHISTRIPQGAQIAVAAAGAGLVPGQSGNSYYSKTVEGAKAGDALGLAFSYTVPAASAPVGGAVPASGSDTTVLLLVAIFLIAFAALLFVVWRKTTATAIVEIEESPDTELPTLDEPLPDASDDEPSAPEAHRVRTRRPASAIAVILGALVVGVVLAVNLATSTPVVGGKITKFFGAASPCSSTTLTVVANQGVDLAKQGTRLVDAFTGQKEIGDVTLDIAGSTISVAFCESAQSEASIRKILTDTGLVTVGAALAPASGTAAPGASGAE